MTRQLSTFEGPAIHIALRFSDTLTAVDTIKTHQKLIAELGYVWIGKMGKSLAHAHVKRINGQCKRGVKTYLILVQKLKTGYDVYSGRIAQIARALPEAAKRHVPRYYDEKEITKYMRLWAKLTALKKVGPEYLSKFRLVASGMILSQTLPRSMAALFIVQRAAR